jgi:DNA polymerase III alpha subunit
LRLTIDLARTLIGFPRHLSQHPGGFVLTEDRLDDLVPDRAGGHGSTARSSNGTKTTSTPSAS